MTDSFELTREMCLDLLRAGLVARVAVSTPVGPHIVPVNCSVVEDGLIIRTTPYSVLGTNAPGSVLALEVDYLDYAQQRGWSVVARGRAELITAAEDLEKIRQVWNPNPWATGSRSTYFRIPLSEVTGRQLGRGWDPLRELPVRRVLEATVAPMTRDGFPGSET